MCLTGSVGCRRRVFICSSQFKMSVGAGAQTSTTNWVLKTAAKAIIKKLGPTITKKALLWLGKILLKGYVFPLVSNKLGIPNFFYEVMKTVMCFFTTSIKFSWFKCTGKMVVLGFKGVYGMAKAAVGGRRSETTEGTVVEVTFQADTDPASADPEEVKAETARVTKLMQQTFNSQMLADELRKNAMFANLTNTSSLDEPDLVTPELLALAGDETNTATQGHNKSTTSSTSSSDSDKILGLQLHYLVLAIAGAVVALLLVGYFAFGRRTNTEPVHSAKVIDVMPSPTHHSVQMSQFPKHTEAEEWK